jgi:broad specificity phosphatase PhoE
METKTLDNLYLIRHAESMHNVKEKYTTTHPTEESFVNTRLSDLGCEQASKLKGNVELLILSPLRRTIETYTHSNLCVKRLITSDLFREYMIYGPASQFELESPKQESEQELHERIIKAKEFIKQQPEKNIAILGHGVFLSHLAYSLGRPINGMYNAQVININNISL